MTLVIVKEDGTIEPAIRSLTEEEHELFSGAALRAVNIVPAFRDAIALIRPFFDATCSTCYTDKYSRVGLSRWFFEDLTTYQRASCLLHEAFHILNNTFPRGAALGADPQLGNIASDFEINCSLDKLEKVDLSFGIFPDKEPFNYDRYLTMEQYYHLLKTDPAMDPHDEDCPEHGDNKDKSDDGDDSDDGSPGDSGDDGDSEGDGNGDSDGDDQDGSGDGNSGDDGSGDGDSDGDGSGDSSSKSHGHGKSKKTCTCKHKPGQGQPGSGGSGGSGCESTSEEREEAADGIGVERASEAEQSITKKNTAIRMEEELKQARAAGSSSMTDFLQLALTNFAPPKVNWRALFRRIMSRTEEAIVRGRSDYSYRRPNRRLSDSKYVFPGMVKYEPSIMFGIDTSGSMTHHDYQRTIQEVEGIIKASSRSKNGLRVFSIDTQIKDIQPVDSVSKIKFQGGGGTDMSAAWRYLQSVPKKSLPDVFVLSTDGFTNWQSVETELAITRKAFKSIILVTTEEGFKTVPASLHSMAPVIDISDK